MDYSLINFRSFSGELLGAGTRVTDIPIGSKIVHVDILQSGTASNSWLHCGGLILAKNYARDSETDLAFTSTTTCSIQKTGSDDSFFTITYSTQSPIYPFSGGSGSTSSSTYLTADGVSMVYFGGILLFIAMLFFFRGIFDVKRYD